jgi:hypothetical protein
VRLVAIVAGDSTTVVVVSAIVAAVVLSRPLWPLLLAIVALCVSCMQVPFCAFLILQMHDSVASFLRFLDCVIALSCGVH